MALTSKQRAALRSAANTIDPVFQIGKGEIDETLCEALDCECVQVIGRKFVLFKKKKKESAFDAVFAK